MKGGNLSLREEVKAGLIILISLILLSGFIILIGGSQFFEKLDRYYVKVMNAAGLEVGAQVKLGGVRVGRVLSITPPDGPGKPITIEIGITRGTTLYQGTKASITQVGFVGDIYLLLSVDKTTDLPIKVGETIPSEEQIQFGRMMARMEDLSRAIENLISDVNKLFSQKNIGGIEKVIENTNKTIVSASSNLNQIVNALKGTTDKLESVLNEIGVLVSENKVEVSLMVRRARETVEKVKETVEKAGLEIEKAGGEIRKVGSGIEKAEGMIKAFEDTARSINRASQSANSAIQSADKTIKSFDNTMKTVRKTIDLQSQNLDHLLNMLTQTTEDLQELLQEIKARPWGLLYRQGRGKEE